MVFGAGNERGEIGLGYKQWRREVVEKRGGGNLRGTEWEIIYKNTELYNIAALSALFKLGESQDRSVQVGGVTGPNGGPFFFFNHFDCFLVKVESESRCFDFSLYYRRLIRRLKTLHNLNGI